MRSFTAVVTSTLPPEEAFAALTDWERHGRFVPLTTVTVLERTGGVGTTFRARTGAGPLRLDDDMVVTRWEPPRAGGAGGCTITKTGRLRGAADIDVEPDGTGSRVRWTESVGIGPAWLAPVADRASVVPGRLLFGRVARGLLRDREREVGRG